MLSGSPVSVAASAAPDQLLERFLSASPRQRRSLLGQLESRASELAPLIGDRLDGWDATGDDWALGFLLQLLLKAGDQELREQVLARYPDGWLAVTSGAGLDYAPLQRHLMLQDFEAADRITSELLRQLAGSGAMQRGYVYYSEVPAIAGVDLESLDRLWLVYSRGRFGFSVQGRLLAACGGRWELLWPRLGWKHEGLWTRYPGSFTWSIEAPEGHMPLLNQLRGVRLMDALLRHPALRQRIKKAAG
ncbi:GUN4 domain-containing protein [Synechococcus sp. CBW1006]|uniref:GUN4 domain-containing protein n=1 Tax=Synechococcus sp. CBW1006 TaxID=1353138 RepID=UPI0018CEE16F|nr:GUN4 domain-containing protein [Synechococcus sp. CBW1006]QPN66142.1 GUN4 domain-containing protein [Synechococcus sp. CBW1006]